MRVKLSHTVADYTDYPFMKKKTVEEIEQNILPPTVNGDRGITSSKKKTNIDSLVNHMQTNKQKMFWHDLAIDDNVDDLENTNYE